MEDQVKIEHKDITIILPKRGFGKRYALSDEQIKAINFTKRKPFEKSLKEIK